MKKRILWVLVSCLMALSLVLVSCGPAVTEEEEEEVITEEEEEVPPEEEEVEEEVVTPEKPLYGGTLNVPLAADITDFDTTTVYPMIFSNMVYDKLFLGDITATESQWGFNGIYIPKSAVRGNLVERWEEPDPDTLIMYLRKGVTFQNIDPVNGRELVADDVVYSLERLKGSSYASSVGYDNLFKSAKAIDRYTVEFKFDLSRYHYQSWHGALALGNTWTTPHEVIDKYGNLKDPLVQVGSGPYIIKDYAPGSSYHFAKNPNYWQIDPRYEGENRLPYIEDVNLLIIPDPSTRAAGLRTGKLDILRSGTFFTHTQAETLKTTNPHLKYRELLPETSYSISVRNDLAPFDDVSVRQALSMAVNRESIIDDYFKGHAQFTCLPASPGWRGFYIPPEDWSELAQEVYEYNPTKAKQLLAAAGYPNGFAVEVQVSGALTELIEMLQLVQEDWAAIGVTMNIDVMDFSAYITLRYRHTYPQGSAGAAGIASPHFAFTYYYQEPPDKFRIYNVNVVDDDYYDEKYEELFASYAKPEAEKKQLYSELYMYLLEQAWSINLPYPNYYVFWQPWVKGDYWGQVGLTYYSSGDMYKYLWLDLDTKETITGGK